MFQNNVLAGAAAASTGAYTIDNSCRFNDDDSSYLSKTLGTATDANRWTYSTWFKRGNLISSGPAPSIFTAGSGAGDTDRGDIVIYTDNRLAVSGGSTIYRVTTQVFRDPSAWYHLIVAVNTDESGNDMIKIYINGSQITAFDTTNNPSSGANTGINTAVAHDIGLQNHGGDGLWDGYMSEINFIDGQQLTPSSFGETNDDGVWIPVKFSGTYGDNGFFLAFGDSSALGDDTSGNTNDWTTSGLAAADQMTDTPTDNQITYNLLNNQRSGGTLKDGNLVYNGPGTRTMVSLSANLPPTGKYAVAFSTNNVAANNGWNFGITKSNNTNFGDAAGSNEDVGASDGLNMNPSSSSLYLYDYINSSSINPSQAITTSDEFWMAVDMATGKCFLGIYDASATAMVWIAADAGKDGNPATGANPSITISDMIGSTEYTFAVGAKAPVLTLIKSADISGTTPTGFTYFENVADFPAPTLKDPSTNFQTQLYTGNGTAIGSGGKAVTFTGNSSMQPDIVWIKNRDAADNHSNYDAARGTTKLLEINSTNTETTTAEGVTTFGSDGFTVGSLAAVNTNTEDYVAWCWAAGNSGASNTAGSINTTTTYVDATAGISVSTYTGNGSGGATVGHGLGTTLDTVWILPRSNGDNHLVSNWEDGITAFTEDLNLTNDNAATTSEHITGGSSTTFTIDSNNSVNGSGRTYVAYSFVGIDGFSRFGTYTGTGNADGPFAYCGFKPSLVIIKKASAADGWIMFDNKRNAYNLTDLTLRVNGTDVEATDSQAAIDILSNGFKVRVSGSRINVSSGSFIFMAYAENPFGGDGVAPAPAR